MTKQLKTLNSLLGPSPHRGARALTKNTLNGKS